MMKWERREQSIEPNLNWFSGRFTSWVKWSDDGWRLSWICTFDGELAFFYLFLRRIGAISSLRFGLKDLQSPLALAPLQSFASSVIGAILSDLQSFCQAIPLECHSIVDLQNCSIRLTISQFKAKPKPWRHLQHLFSVRTSDFYFSSAMNLL
jgi:hypothetical protein